MLSKLYWPAREKMGNIPVIYMGLKNKFEI
jgi:hypothetical protein